MFFISVCIWGFWSVVSFSLLLEDTRAELENFCFVCCWNKNTQLPLCLARPEKSNAIKVRTAQPRVLPVQFWLTVTQRDWSHCIFIMEAAGRCSASHSGCLVSSDCKETTSGEEFEKNYYSEKKHWSCKWGRNVSRKSLIYRSVLLQWCNNRALKL